MPTPTKSYNLGIKISGGTATNNNIRISNATTEEVLKKTSDNNQSKANLGNTKEFPSGVSNGDFIEITVSGSRYGSASHTVDTSKGGAIVKVTVADVSSTTHPKVSV